MARLAGLRTPNLDDLEATGLDPRMLLQTSAREAHATAQRVLNRPEIHKKDIYNLRPRLRRLLI